MGKIKASINAMFLSFLGKLTMVTAFIALMYAALINLFPDMTIPSKTVSVFIVLFTVTAGVHYLLLRAGQGEPSRFAAFIILSVVIKLFLYAVFTFLLIIADRDGAMANVVLFFVVYIVLTVFEIGTTYLQIKRSGEE